MATDTFRRLSDRSKDALGDLLARLDELERQVQEKDEEIEQLRAELEEARGERCSGCGENLDVMADVDARLCLDCVAAGVTHAQ